MPKNLSYYRDDFTCDGATTLFATTYAFVTNSTVVFLNGVLLKRGSEYTEGSGLQSITLVSAWPSAYELVIFYTVSTAAIPAAAVSDFQSLMLEDALSCVLNTSEFAEAVTYTPYGSAALSINAIVDRNRLNPDDQSQGKVLQNQVGLYIANDDTYGVVSISKGRDSVSLPAMIGGVNSTWLIGDILGQDDAMWHLLATK